MGGHRDAIFETTGHVCNNLVGSVDMNEICERSCSQGDGTKHERILDFSNESEFRPISAEIHLSVAPIRFTNLSSVQPINAA
jgi:hypothetical protein